MVLILALLTSFLISFLFTYPTIHLAKKFDLVTDRKKRHHPAHTHQGIIPRGGGIPLYFALLITSLLFIPLNKIMVGIFIASFLLVFMGIIDDYFDISPYVRFVGNILISAVVVGFGLGIPYVSSPFGGIIPLDQWRITLDIFGTHSILILADILAILWLTWTTNMINWSKGVDGQLPGFVGIAAIFLGLLAKRFTAHDISVNGVMIFSFIVAGSYIGFLPHNFYPQKIMPGYGGGALAGFLLGVLSILSFGKLGTAILILSVPLIDAIYTIMRRIRYHKSPFEADWGHLHHKLLEIGWGKRRIALFYWLVTFILGASSLFFEGIKKVMAFIAIGILLLIFLFIIERVKKDRFDTI